MTALIIIYLTSLLIIFPVFYSLVLVGINELVNGIYELNN